MKEMLIANDILLTHFYYLRIFYFPRKLLYDSFKIRACTLKDLIHMLSILFIHNVQQSVIQSTIQIQSPLILPIVQISKEIWLFITVTFTSQ